MLGLCIHKTYDTIMKYDNVVDSGCDSGNKDETAMIMPVPYQGPMLQSLIQLQRLGITKEGQARTVISLMGAAHYTSNLLKMCHKLLYTKFEFLNWCRCNMKKRLQRN